MVTTRTLDVPGAHLSYETRGSGPVLVLTGAPMNAAHFAPLADALPDEYTVVTHDPRGISGSTLDDPTQDSTPELRADDIAAILDDIGADSADVFGSSGGAVTGLALVARHPARVRTPVAHEPPVLEVLPDAAERRAEMDDIVETFHREGLGPAFGKFMTVSGMEPAAGPPPGEPSAQDQADGARFLAHELRGTAGYLPDIKALTAARPRVLIAIGTTSGPLLTHRTSTALAAQLGTHPVEFPGGHGGFMEAPGEFAGVFRKVLAG
ncbi:alpha/beta fold hydrolase [Streptomyces sp. NPDC058665]|uniref:alpha/beta fold hydrolase n=1 Tax=Streptomyces sp. NPDC058665 TaxID=3346586 RepID=UPI00365620FE